MSLGQSTTFGRGILIEVICCLLTLTAWAQKIAEPGSPLYSLTVTESIRGLGDRAKDGPVAAAKVCPYCGKVHAAVLNGATNAVTGNATNSLSLAASPARSPETSPVSESKYFYCPNCRVYHPRQPSPPNLTPSPIRNSTASTPIVTPAPTNHTLKP